MEVTGGGGRWRRRSVEVVVEVGGWRRVAVAVYKSGSGRWCQGAVARWRGALVWRFRGLGGAVARRRLIFLSLNFFSKTFLFGFRIMIS